MGDTILFYKTIISNLNSFLLSDSQEYRLTVYPTYIKKKLNCKFNDKDCSVLHGRTLSIFDEINDHALDDESFETIPQVKIPPKENEVDFVK